MRAGKSLLRTVGATAVAVLALSVGAACAQPAGGPQSIDWSIQRGGSTSDASRVQLTIESRWGSHSRSSWSNDRPIAELSGLTDAGMLGPPHPVRFALIRDAGRLDCAGTAGNLSRPARTPALSRRAGEGADLLRSLSPGETVRVRGPT